MVIKNKRLGMEQRHILKMVQSTGIGFGNKAERNMWNCKNIREINTKYDV